MPADPDAALARARALVTAASRVAVLTGAGISTDSGIPDFRGPDGVWTKNPAAERLATIDHYLSSPDARREAWRRSLDRLGWTGREPNAGHRALVALEARGTLDTLVTQNVDGLHRKAGTSPACLVEIHGTLDEVGCLSCATRWPADAIFARVRAGEDDPPCTVCGGILKVATISFGQSLVAADLDRASDAAQRCDLLLAVGTSLTVTPISSMVPLAARHGARVVIVNAEATPYDTLADVVVRTGISEALPVICGVTDR